MPQTADISLFLRHGPLKIEEPQLSRDEFWELCQRNPNLEMERTAQGKVLLMSPTGGTTGNRNSRLTRYVDEWAEESDTGYAFDSSTLFELPSGAERSPDAAWVRKDRWDALTDEERDRPAPLCPDFVVELMSPTDRIKEVQNKMLEYMANGARLGFLIDRKTRQVHVYRPNQTPQILVNPATVSGDPELPGFILPLARIF